MDRTPRSAVLARIARRASRRVIGLGLLAGAVGGGLFLIAGGAGAARAPGAAAVVAPAPVPTVHAVAVAPVEQRFTADDGQLVTTDRQLTIDGTGFYGTAFGPYVHFRRADGSVVEAAFVILESPQRIVAGPPRGTYGSVTLIVENPDHASATFSVGL